MPPMPPMLRCPHQSSHRKSPHELSLLDRQPQSRCSKEGTCRGHHPSWTIMPSSCPSSPRHPMLYIRRLIPNQVRAKTHLKLTWLGHGWTLPWLACVAPYNDGKPRTPKCECSRVQQGMGLLRSSIIMHHHALIMPIMLQAPLSQAPSEAACAHASDGPSTTRACIDGAWVVIA